MHRDGRSQLPRGQILNNLLYFFNEICGSSEFGCNYQNILIFVKHHQPRNICSSDGRYAQLPCLQDDIKSIIIKVF